MFCKCGLEKDRAYQLMADESIDENIFHVCNKHFNKKLPQERSKKPRFRGHSKFADDKGMYQGFFCK